LALSPVHVMVVGETEIGRRTLGGRTDVGCARTTALVVVALAADALESEGSTGDGAGRVKDAEVLNSDESRHSLMWVGRNDCGKLC
jgi:hypothetical protein